MNWIDLIPALGAASVLPYVFKKEGAAMPLFEGLSFVKPGALVQERMQSKGEKLLERIFQMRKEKEKADADGKAYPGLLREWKKEGDRLRTIAREAEKLHGYDTPEHEKACEAIAALEPPNMPSCFNDHVLTRLEEERQRVLAIARNLDTNSSYRLTIDELVYLEL